MGSSFGGRASAVPRPILSTSLGSAVALDAVGDAVTVGVILNDVATSHAQGDFFVLKSRGSDGLQLWRRELDGGSAGDSASGVAVDAIGSVFAGGSLTGKYTVLQLNGTDGISTPQPTSVTLHTSPNPSSLGELVTFDVSATAASGPPDGMIEVFEGVASVATATLSSGTASFSRTDLLPGTHSFAARYLGNEFFADKHRQGSRT